MARKTSSREKQEPTGLEEELSELKDHIQVLVNAIDELREELQWIAHNRLPEPEPPRTSPVLKRMAADPSADDWGERLEIVRGEPEPEPEEMTPGSAAPKDQPTSSPDRGGPAGQLF